MSLPTAYTPLETLLLFQALRSETVDAHSAFNRISDQLKALPLIRSHPTYDSGRLSPDALRELYLWLLKEEAKSELERQLERDKLLHNGDLSPNSRKRKAVSPSLPTVHEASRHAHLIPQLVTRLYARYREHTVREIRTHERQHDNLTRDIQDIEAGKWNERLKKDGASAATTQDAASISGAGQVQTNDEAGEQATSKPYTQTNIDASVNHGVEPQNGVPDSRRGVSSGATLPLQSQMGLETDALGPQSANRSFTKSPSAGPFVPPYGQQPLSRPGSSRGVALPHAAGIPFPASPGRHTGSPVHVPPMAQQQHYASPHPPPMPAVGPPGRERAQYAYPPSHSPVPPGYYQPQAYHDPRGQYMPLQQQPVLGYPGQHPHAGGYPLQQPPAEGQDPNRANRPDLQQQQHPHALYQSPGYAQGPPTYPSYSVTAPSTGPRRPPNGRRVTDVIDALATPPRKDLKPVWKRPANITPVKAGTPIPRPQAEPLSPGLKRSEAPIRATRSSRTRGAALSEQPEEPDALPMPPKVRGRMNRERTPHSVVSSTADESTRMTRSHSVSTAGALPTSDDRPESRGNVKIEPSTPAGFADDSEAATQDVQSGGRLTRKRRGTLQSLQQPPQKRKRQHSASGFGDATDDAATPPPRSSTVTATRNFHKLSQTIMNDINSHKHASYFANPVRDRDAPGYNEIIKHPQNLKSIRAAITAGSKAVQAAAVESPSAAETPTKVTATADGSATTIEIERTEDIIPPKAIVNAAQLEKEVLRMFANAVMFNPGDDGLVADAREMFDDVEAKMREWRGAEKEAGTGAAVEAEEEEVVGKGKRRKL